MALKDIIGSPRVAGLESGIANSSNQRWTYFRNPLKQQAGGACTWAGSNGSHYTVDVEDLGNVFASSPRVLEKFQQPRIQHSRHHRVFRPFFNDVPTTNFSFYKYPSREDNFDCFNSCYDQCQIMDDPIKRQGGFVDDRCTESQWLACPIPNCPVFSRKSGSRNDQNLGFSQGNQPPPCLDSSLKEFEFYRGCYPNYCSFIQDEGDQRCLEDYLSTEKRKEKSRDAARCRRSRETDIFVELAAALPFPDNQSAHLDKASVMRLAIAYLKVRSIVDTLAVPTTKKDAVVGMNALFPEALDGFMLVLSNNGDMVYLSENVSDYLGVSQMDMMGQSVYEYSHPCDHDEIRDCLAMKLCDVEEKHPCNFFLRLKCTLTSKGRKVNLKSASYKVIHCIGRSMLTRNAVSNTTESTDVILESRESILGSCSEDSQDSIENRPVHQSTEASLVVIGCPIPHPSNIEVPLGRHTFLSKHNLTMKFTYADDRLAEYLGWSSEELIGKSVFEFYHALDNAVLDKSFKSLFSKGQCETMAYRFLGKTGGFAWVVTQATLIRCTKQQKPLSIVCVNYILSDVECKDDIYSLRQLEARNVSEQLREEKSINNQIGRVLQPPSLLETHVLISPIETEIVLPKIGLIIPGKRIRPQAVTASIFKDCVVDNKQISSINDITNTAVKKEKRLPWVFQNKVAVEYDSSRSRSSIRPQAFTRSLFGSDNQQPVVNCRPPPHTATASIFAPRTEDMNKGFLTFSEDQPGLTMLKDEPEDLTHLAPTPGDVCVPLEDTPFLSDMLDEFILGNEVYCPLLSPSLSPELIENPESTEEGIMKDTADHGRSIKTSLADADPFFYRDDSPSLGCGISQSSSLLLPVLGKSSEPENVDSLYSSDNVSTALGSGISEDDVFMLSINDVIADEELALRAPYIPMSDQDEALQLLISDDMVMWGPSQPPEKRTKWNNGDDFSKRYSDSSLAKLLKSTSDKLDKRNSECLVDPAQVLWHDCRKGAAKKRHHGSTSMVTGRESKRIRCQTTSNMNHTLETSTFYAGSTSTSVAVTRTGNCHEFIDARQQKNKLLLLEQLLDAREDNVTKSYVINNEKEDRQMGDDGSGYHQEVEKQTNSVLMNLLVSGCDSTCVEFPQLSGRKSRN